MRRFFLGAFFGCCTLSAQAPNALVSKAKFPWTVGARQPSQNGGEDARGELQLQADAGDRELRTAREPFAGVRGAR